MGDIESLQYELPYSEQKIVEEGSHIFDKTTAFRSWHFGESSQDSGGQTVPIIQVDHQGNKPSGFLGLMSEFEVPAASLNLNINNITTQNNIFFESEYGVKKIRKPRYDFQTRSQIDILDDGYRWRKYAQNAVKNNRLRRYVPSLIKLKEHWINHPANVVRQRQLKELYELGVPLGVGETAFINNITTQNNIFFESEYGVKKIRKPRYAFQTRSQIDLLDDGYRWRKYAQNAVKNNRMRRQRQLKELYELGVPLGVGETAFPRCGWSSQNGGGQVHIIQDDHYFSRSIQLASAALTGNTLSDGLASVVESRAALCQAQSMNEDPPFDILKLTKMFLLISTEEGLALLAIWFSVGASLSANARILLRGAGICSAIGFHSSLGSYILQYCSRRAEPAARFLTAQGAIAAACGFTSVSCLFLPQNLMLFFSGIIGIMNIFILPFLFIKKH